MAVKFEWKFGWKFLAYAAGIIFLAALSHFTIQANAKEIPKIEENKDKIIVAEKDIEALYKATDDNAKSISDTIEIQKQNAKDISGLAVAQAEFIGELRASRREV